MFTWLIRIVLVAAGTVTALFVAQDAENFSVVQGMVAIVLIAALVLMLALVRRK